LQPERNMVSVDLFADHHRVHLPLARLRTVRARLVVPGVMQPQLTNATLGERFDELFHCLPTLLILHICRAERHDVVEEDEVEWTMALYELVEPNLTILSI